MATIFTTACNNYQSGNNQWLEITENKFWELFETMPLIFNDEFSFMMDEIYCESANGLIYIVCKQDGDKYYTQLMTKAEYKKEFNKVKT